MNDLHKKLRTSPILKNGKIKRLKDFTQAENIFLHNITDEEYLKTILRLVVKQRTLSESVMREWKEYIRFEDLSIWQDLSENFVREMCKSSDDVMFVTIGNHQHLTPKFLDELEKEWSNNDRT